MTLLFLLCHWHGLAKLRMHMDNTLGLMELITVMLGNHLCMFANETCSAFSTKKLRHEAEGWTRHQGHETLQKFGNTSSRQKDGQAPTRKAKTLNLQTYKLHALGDYPEQIWTYGDTHRTGSVQWTWKKTAKEHDDTIAMNEYRTIRAHPVHLDSPKLKKSHTNAKNEHGNSWPFSTLGQLHWRIVQTRILSCKRWLPNVHSHLSHKNCPLRIAIMKKELGDEDESDEEIMHTWCTHHLPPKKHPRKSKNRRETKKNGDRKSTCD